MTPKIKIEARRHLLIAALGLSIVTAVPAAAIVGASAPAPELAAYAVMVLNRSGKTAGFCSASVLAQNVVLTAAHCVAEPSNTRVHFRGEKGEAVLADVAAIVRHPAYRADAVRTRRVSIDLALIRLAEPLPARFKPVALAETSTIKAGQEFRIAGFGVTQEGSGTTSGVLRIGRIAARLPLSQVLLWAHDPAGQGTGACTGDSGGPILALDHEDVERDAGGKPVSTFPHPALDQPLLVAVTDWAEGADAQKCGALTQGALVAPQRAWIESVLAGWVQAQ